MSETTHKHEHNEHECACSTTIYSSVHQTLDEMAFERGIWHSALHGDLVKIKAFLSKGIDVDLRDQSGYTALVSIRELDVCDLLLRSGADSNAETRAGRSTPIHRAAYQGHLDIVCLLVKYGANVELTDSDGKTPLHKAAETGKTEVCQFLMEVKPELLSIKDNHSKTAMDLANDQNLKQILDVKTL